MPAKEFICLDGERIEIKDCLERCRMDARCATKPYLEMIGYDRGWKGISPSSAGTGVRCLYLKATTDYAIRPNDRAFAALGTAVHRKLSIHAYTRNVLSEEALNGDQMKGIADCLEMDENAPGEFCLTDYKTSGSYKVAQWLGIQKKIVPILDDNGNAVLLKSGKNKGEPKTKSVFLTETPDLQDVALQLNSYRIFFEKAGFPISRMQIQAIVRDGGTFIATSRGIDRSIYIIDVPKLPNSYVTEYYNKKIDELIQAFDYGYAKKCSDEECWGGRRCEKWCEVKDECDKL